MSSSLKEAIQRLEKRERAAPELYYELLLIAAQRFRSNFVWSDIAQEVASGLGVDVNMSAVISHGTRKGYCDGCRCSSCTAAETSFQADEQRRVAREAEQRAHDVKRLIEVLSIGPLPMEQLLLKFATNFSGRPDDIEPRFYAALRRGLAKRSLQMSSNLDVSLFVLPEADS